MHSIALFNNKDGVGKTTLVFHLAHMFSELQIKTLVVDLDPQANLTNMFLTEEAFLNLFPESAPAKTFFGAMRNIISGSCDVQAMEPINITNFLDLLPGDLGLSSTEEWFSKAWNNAIDGQELGLKQLSAIHRLINQSASSETQVVLINVGANLGALSRASLLCADSIIIPVAPDLFSLQGLNNLFPKLAEWKHGKAKMLAQNVTNTGFPEHEMSPIGYVIMQQKSRGNEKIGGYKNWIQRIAVEFASQTNSKIAENELGALKNYLSLMQMAELVRKPIFKLKSGDGAFGAHLEAVQFCFKDFKKLANVILARVGIEIST